MIIFHIDSSLSLHIYVYVPTPMPLFRFVVYLVYNNLCNLLVAWWPKGVGLAIIRSWVRLEVGSLLGGYYFDV